jgi:hypothetical protein
MNWRGILGSLGALVLLCGPLAAQTSNFAIIQTSAQAPAPQANVLPAPTPLNGSPSAAPSVDHAPLPVQIVDDAPLPPPRTPPMFGDFLGPVGQVGILNGQVQVFPTGIPGDVRSQTRLISGNTIRVLAPITSAASFKIAENESPMPQDRVFFAYNFYDNLQHSVTGFQVATPNMDLHRETIGFEKTFFGGDASFGVRLPFQQIASEDGIGDSDVGDLSLIFKYALFNDRATGNVLSTGMVVTIPTGGQTTIEGESPIGAVLFQPFLGFVVNADVLYVQGFSSLAVPTDARLPTLWFNSIAAGWWAYRNPAADCLTALVPTVELHVNTPLSHRGITTEPIGFPDTVDVTAGCHFQFHQATLGVAVGAPMTGPKPYDIEVLANFNWNF